MYLLLICLNQEYEEKNEPTEDQEEAPPPETEKPEEDEKQPPEEEQPPEPEPIMEAEPQPATMGDLLVCYVYPFVYLFHDVNALGK